MREELRKPLIYVERYFKVQSKPDAHGVAYLVPMKLWPSQKFYIENRTHRDIILKNRQTGMSTGILASNAHAFFTQKNERQVIVTHDDETSTFLLATIRRFHSNLPAEVRPKKGYDAGHRLSLEDFDSYMYIDSARSDSIGIGHGLTRAHLSEMSKWPPRKEDQLFADISQTVPEGGYITIESTPKGRVGKFHQLYELAKVGDINYKYFFFPWWWDITCVADPKLYLTIEKAVSASKALNMGLEGYLKEETMLKDKANLSPEQVAFRRLKIGELKELFYQEYPENDVDCWLTSDIGVFDGVSIRKYLQQTNQGRQEGNLTIWKDVIGGERYVIGCDPAGGLERGDYSVASVLRVRSNEYVARLRGKIPPDLFAQEIMNLGKRYNFAEIGVERIMHGHTVLKVLMDANYPNIYHHQDYDMTTGGAKDEPGWITSLKTKPLMIDAFQLALRASDIMIWSENLLLEASGYIWEGQKAKASQGGYDDELVALMIALQLREQLPITEYKRAQAVSYIRL